MPSPTAGYKNHTFERSQTGVMNFPRSLTFTRSMERSHTVHTGERTFEDAEADLEGDYYEEEGDLYGAPDTGTYYEDSEAATSPPMSPPRRKRTASIGQEEDIDIHLYPLGQRLSDRPPPDGGSKSGPMMSTAVDEEMGDPAATRQRSHRRSMSITIDHRQVAVIGTGLFGTALGGRIAEAGYTTVFGSRSGKIRPPAKLPENCLLTSVKRAIFMGDIIILALPAEQILRLLKDSGHALANKIVVDATNPGKVPAQHGMPSMGELTQKMLPDSQVVKCFNTCSAYQLRSADTSGGPKVVELCGKSARAKTTIATIIYDIGFTPADIGGIQAAWRLEELPMHFFSKWRLALFVSFCMALPLAAYIIARDISTKGGWAHLPAGGMAKVAGWLSIYLLAATYLAGMVATVARKPLYRWMIRWLEIRKQLGLIAFFVAAIHTVLAICVLRPQYARLHDIFYADGTLNAIGETTILLGVIAMACLCVLSIVSLPSVSASLSWQEWDFMQKKMGWTSLVMATAHVLVFAPQNGAWTSVGSWPRHLPPTSILVVAPVAFCVAFKCCLMGKNKWYSFTARFRRAKKYQMAAAK